MKRLLLLLLLPLLFALPLSAQFSLPSSKPIVCSGPANNCSYPVVTNGHTAIVVARQMLGKSITIYGMTINPDYVDGFNGDAIYHLDFNGLPWPTSVDVTFPANTGYDVFLLLYEGIWQYQTGAGGDYSFLNSAFPSKCINGQDCPYWWTYPIVPNKGDLLISFANANASGCTTYRPGPGWAIESTTCNFVAEDKIAGVEAPEIGSMYSSLANGSDSGGSHWVMGLASYRRTQ